MTILNIILDAAPVAAESTSTWDFLSIKTLVSAVVLIAVILLLIAHVDKVGIILGVISLIIMLVGLIPLLGWLNWISIPVAIIGLIFSAFGKKSNGLKICGIVVIFGILRLILGGGIF